MKAREQLLGRIERIEGRVGAIETDSCKRARTGVQGEGQATMAGSNGARISTHADSYINIKPVMTFMTKVHSGHLKALTRHIDR